MLLDPATGTSEVVQGEFEPLGHQFYRPLQLVQGTREYWAALVDVKNQKTKIGRYDVQAFKLRYSAACTDS